MKIEELQALDAEVEERLKENPKEIGTSSTQDKPNPDMWKTVSDQIEAKLRERLDSGMPFPEVAYSCPKCHDTGQIVTTAPDGFSLTVTDCECERLRRNRLRVERSGLSETLDRYTFDTYQTPDDKTAAIKSAALRYASQKHTPSWFVITGTPGSGKTHICTAIVGKLIDSGFDCRYMLWRDEVRELKSLSNEYGEYRSRMRQYKRAEVLYIDDFLKGSVTEADLNVAFELINTRYNTGLRTIISGERSIQELMELDEAVGSRIYERSKRGYLFAAPDTNRRLDK